MKIGCQRSLFRCIPSNIIFLFKNCFHGGPKTTRAVLFEPDTGAATHPTESVNRLDMLSIATPAQNMLKRLSITAGRNIMAQFYDYSLLAILVRLRGLHSLRFRFNGDEDGNGLRYPPAAEGGGGGEEEEGGPESNGRRFVRLVDCELAHVEEVTVEESSAVDYATDYGAALQQVVSALGQRNEAWNVPRRLVRTFWGGSMGEEGEFYATVVFD